MASAMNATWGNNPVAMMNPYDYMVFAFSALLAGALLDRYGARMTMPFATAFVGACTLQLAKGNEQLGILGFTPKGIGAVFGIAGAIYVVAKLLPPTNLPTFVGLTQMIGMAGAAAGSKPVAILIERDSGLGWSWQTVWPMFAAIGAVLAVLLWIVLPKSESAQTAFTLKSLVQPYQVAFENSQTYLCGLIGGLLFAPTTIGVMVWATEFLHHPESGFVESTA
jgi:MFS family permease